MKTLVVARYQEDSAWYERIPRGWNLREIQKGREVENTGREVSSFLWAILDMYDSLQDDDVVGFVQGDPFDHCPDIDIFLLLDRPTPEYRALGNDALLSDGRGGPHHPGLPVMERYEEWLGVPFPGSVRFAPGGQFVAPGSAIKRHPKEFWQRLFDQMGVDPNPWVMERLWGTVLGTPRVNRATFYRQATPITAYLRCELPARYLPGQVMTDVPVVHTSDTEFTMPLHEGAAVFQFAGDAWWHLMAHALQHKGHRVLLESDDNYNTVSPAMNRSGWTKRKGDGPHSIEGQQSILKTVDGVIVTTEFLANQYRKHNPNVYVCPNSIDPLDWPELTKPDDGILRIGWFASGSHGADAKLIHRAMEWASRQKDVQVWTMGMDPHWKFERGYFPWSDLPLYRKRMAVLDIGVAPITPTAWSLCRSDVKAIEKAYCGAAVVLSDVAPYSLFTDGENCLKAADAAGFYKRIKHLVANRDEVKQLAEAGREYVLRERLITQQIHTWRDALAD
jgi:hypothetical protein